jgi:Asp-tRNA(Asn)/Glu-tRNA(Gln) amidotransferase A subunit family amidase
MLGQNDTWVGVPAGRIARAVRRGDATATWVAVDHLDYAARVDGQLRAMSVVRDGTAIAEAELVDDQPDLSHLSLAGVPVVVPQTVAVAGLHTPDGLAWSDHEVVRRLRGAGAIVLGTARTGGTNRNPWRSDRIPGGSAGGGAAAVAAGLAPISVAADTRGALRVAAACCGLVAATSGHGLGILATTANDAGLGLAVLTGRDPASTAEPRRLRIGVVPVPGVDRATRRAVINAGRLLVGQGHDVVLLERRRERAAVLLMPTLTGPPPRLAAPRWLQALQTAHALRWARSEQPTVVLPLGVREDGLPDSVQLVGEPGAEPLLLAVAARLELVGRRRHAPGWPRPAVGPTWDLATAGRHRATIGA